MRELRWLALMAALLLGGGCRTGPNPYCVQQCETENDSCMLDASSAAEIGECDTALTRCIGYCS